MSGLQLRIDSFPARGSFERELFLYRKPDNAADVYVSRIETLMRPAANEMRDIRNADGTMNAIAMLPMACHVFFGGAVVAQRGYRFPDGVALRRPPSTGLDLNAHYVNRTGAEFPGEVQVNLHTVVASQVRTVASRLNLQNTDIAIRAHSDTTIRKTFVVSEPTMTIITLTSHMHEHGTRFVVRLKDGQVIYDNTDWAHPLVRTFDTPLVLEKGEALVSEVTCHNTTERVIRFGLTSEDEMGIVFGYFY